MLVDMFFLTSMLVLHVFSVCVSRHGVSCAVLGNGNESLQNGR